MSRTRITHEDGIIYEFTPHLESVTTVEPGEKLTVETIDSLDGAVQSEGDLLESVPEEVNAATGPIAVAGAEPGDVLAVEIEEIRIAEDRGRVITIDGFGLLDDPDHDEVDVDIEAPRTRMTPISDSGSGSDSDSDSDDSESLVLEWGGLETDLEVPVDPVVGTIGVAPAAESYTTLVPHDHGGNLDTTDVTAGNTVYFPVFQEDAMLAMGDCKAAMADGEMCGTGAEVSTEIDLTLEVVDGPRTSIDRPFVETPSAWKTVASAETLEQACELAHSDLLDLLVADPDHGFDHTDAHMVASLVGGLEISQVVDPLVTVRNAIPKRYLSQPF